jgi:outer membrane receptor protein involved in Fe transport
LTSAAGQYNGQQGGNLNLRPEEGKTTAVGLVFTPSFVPGFAATIDYSDIKMTGVITSYGPNIVQANCIASGDAASVWCQAIHRDSNGTLWASPQGYTVDPLVNLSGLENKSVDVSLAYRVDMGSFGRLRSRMDGTYLLKLLTTPGAKASFDCAGRFGSTCGPVTPKWRHRLALDWDTPLTGVGVGATWRFFGGAKNTLTDPSNPDYAGAASLVPPPVDALIPTISYLDLRASYAWNKVTVRAGVQNVLDKDPPLIDTINSGGNSTYAESNTYPSVYDSAGRFLYLSVTVDF